MQNQTDPIRIAMIAVCSQGKGSKSVQLDKYLNIDIPRVPVVNCNCPTAYSSTAQHRPNTQEVCSTA